MDDLDKKNLQDNLNEINEASKITRNQIKNTTQEKIKLESLAKTNLQDTQKKTISTFEDLIKLSSLKKEVELKYDLERNVNLIKFSEGKIDIAFNENLGKNFVRNLSEKLLEWTQKRWVITLTKGEAKKTFVETQTIKKNELLTNKKKGEIYKKFKDFFPDAELIDVSKKD